MTEPIFTTAEKVARHDAGYDKENADLSVILGFLLHFGEAELSVHGTTELHWSAGAITITSAEAELLRARGMVS